MLDFVGCMTFDRAVQAGTKAQTLSPYQVSASVLSNVYLMSKALPLAGTHMQM